MTAEIEAKQNGPYVVTGVQSVTNAAGEDISAQKDRVFLCRCGQSSNKPYCDGTHKNNGFSDEKLTAGSHDKSDSYIGEHITIHDNRGICAHAGVCTDNLKTVFRLGQEPWIDPDGASIEEIIRIVESCPSGALACSLGDVEHVASTGEARIRVIRDGPYAVSGGIELDGQTPRKGASAGRYTLCRCGASKNKPFCDGSHWHVGFSDETA